MNRQDIRYSCMHEKYKAMPSNTTQTCRGKWWPMAFPIDLVRPCDRFPFLQLSFGLLSGSREPFAW